MPLRETEAIVLRTYRLGEADKIASLFTRQLGRLRAVARGALRPKSRYGGTLEPLSYVRLWIFERENRDLLHLNSVEIIESFFDMQKDYRVQLAAQYLAEVGERLLPEREVNERIFRLLLAVLRALKHSGEVNRPLLYFDYWMVRLGGFLPDFETCSACGRALGEEGGYYCPRFRNPALPRLQAAGQRARLRRQPGHGSRRLPPASRKVAGAGKGSPRLPRSAPLLRGNDREPHGTEAGDAADDGGRSIRGCPGPLSSSPLSLVAV